MRLSYAVLALVAALLIQAPPAFAAAGGGKSKPDEGGAHVDLAQLALPVIVNGKIKNYVFVMMRLKPGPGADVAKLKSNEPYYRDAIVRAGHRTSFAAAGDWTTVDERRLEAVLLAEARRISGPKAFAGAELMRQTPRQRTGMLQAKAPAH